MSTSTTPSPRTLLLFLLLALLGAPPASAGYLMWMDEVGGNVELTGSGKMSRNAWTLYQVGAASGAWSRQTPSCTRARRSACLICTTHR